MGIGIACGAVCSCAQWWLLSRKLAFLGEEDALMSSLLDRLGTLYGPLSVAIPLLGVISAVALGLVASALPEPGAIPSVDSGGAMGAGDESRRGPALSRGIDGRRFPGASPGRSSSSGVGALAVTCMALSFLAGLTRPLGWMPLLPHSPYPQPIAGAAYFEWQRWQEGTGFLVILPTALCVAAAVALARLASRDPLAARASLACMCAGELAFRLCGRLVPGIYGTSDVMAVIACALHLALLGAFVSVASFRARRGASAEGVISPAESGDVARSDGDEGDAAWLRSALSRGMWECLRERGLSEREILVVCGAMRGLDGPRIADMVGIGSSTVREYRRRCREKLGIEEFGEVGQALARIAAARGEGVPSGEGLAEGRWGGARGELVVAGVALLMTVTLLLAPMPWVARDWTAVWTTSVGLGVGVLLWLAAWRVGRERVRLAPARVSAHALAAGALLLGLAVAASVLARTGALRLEPGHAPAKALSLAAGATLSLACGCLAPACSGALRASLSRAAGSGHDAAGRAAACLCAMVGLAVALASRGVAVWATFQVLAAAIACSSLVVPIVREAREGRDDGAAAVDRTDSEASPVVDACLRGRNHFPGDARRRPVGLAPVRCLGPAPLPLLGAAFLVSWLWEESWRAPRWAVRALPLSACVALLAVGSAILAMRPARGGERAWLVVSAVACVALGMRLGVTAGSLSLLGLSVAWGWARAAPTPAGGAAPEAGCGHREDDARGPSGTSVWRSPAFASAVGLVFGPLITNAYGVQLLSWRPFGVFPSQSVAAAVISWALFAAGALIVCLALLELGRAAEPSLAPPASRTDGARMKLYLASLGFSDETIDVALRTCAGQSVSSIAEATHRSRTGVWKMRRDVFDRLGARTAPQLLARLTEEIRAT